MITNKKLAAWVEECKKGDSYWVEGAKLDFAISLEKQRKSSNMSYADLAKRFKTSAAYISKVFRGDSNMTIESMVKLARASGGKLNIEIINESEQADASHITTEWTNVHRLQVGNIRGNATNSVSSYTFLSQISSNGDHQQTARAA